MRMDYLMAGAAIAAALAMGTAQAAHATGSGPAYDAALAELTQMHQSCQAMGGTMVYDDGHLVEINFTDDGVPDYVVDATFASCDSAASLFCGSAGCAVTAFASNAGRVIGTALNLYDPRALPTALTYGCPQGGRGQLSVVGGQFQLTGC